MRRVVIAVGLCAAVLAGCSGASESCGDIADEGIDLIQEFVDEVDAMDADAIADAISDSEFLGDLEARANSLDERAAAAGCSEDEMAGLLDDRSGDLSAGTEFGQIIVDLILDDAFFTPE
ncbi:MAG: hypothetical protein OEM97_07015 [Acidimicrobiia bacterium]|nr:hypothetical protein [Acidimicrobiia bacterium]